MGLFHLSRTHVCRVASSGGQSLERAFAWLLIALPFRILLTLIDIIDWRLCLVIRLHLLAHSLTFLSSRATAYYREALTVSVRGYSE